MASNAAFGSFCDNVTYKIRVVQSITPSPDPKKSPRIGAHIGEVEGWDEVGVHMLSGSRGRVFIPWVSVKWVELYAGHGA